MRYWHILKLNWTGHLVPRSSSLLPGQITWQSNEKSAFHGENPKFLNPKSCIGFTISRIKSFFLFEKIDYLRWMTIFRSKIKHGSVSNVKNFFIWTSICPVQSLLNFNWMYRYWCEFWIWIRSSKIVKIKRTLLTVLGIVLG